MKTPLQMLLGVDNRIPLSKQLENLEDSFLFMLNAFRQMGNLCPVWGIYIQVELPSGTALISRNCSGMNLKVPLHPTLGIAHQISPVIGEAIEILTVRQGQLSCLVVARDNRIIDETPQNPVFIPQQVWNNLHELSIPPDSCVNI